MTYLPKKTGIKNKQVQHGELKKVGLDNKSAWKSREIFDHPGEVQEVIKEAEENQDIPTKTAALNKIKEKRNEEILQKNREQTVDYEVKPDLPSFLEDCITNQNQVNIVLKEILLNPDQIESDCMETFINELQGTINILKNFQEDNKKWQKLRLTM